MLFIAFEDHLSFLVNSQDLLGMNDVQVSLIVQAMQF
jgi:hypothetical protein